MREPPVDYVTNRHWNGRAGGTAVELVHVDEGGGFDSGRFIPNGGTSDPRDAFHVPFDPRSEQVVDVVVNAVAVIHNVDPMTLSPLANAVNPDALVSLVRSGSAVDRPVEVTFDFENLEITVSSDGHVWLEWE